MTSTISLAAQPQVKRVRQRNLWIDAIARFRRNLLAVGSLIFVIFVLLLSIFGPLISPYDYRRQDLLDVASPPSAAHWFGTDSLGRDYLTRIMMGGRTAFLVAFVVVSITTVIGVALGAFSAYRGGWVDGLLMRFTDTILSFPHILLAMFIAGTLRPRVVDWANTIPSLRGSIFPDILTVFGALAIVGWPGHARLVRGQVLSLREMEFIEAERMIGASTWKIIKDHLVPNAIGSVIVLITVEIGQAMLL